MIDRVVAGIQRGEVVILPLEHSYVYACDAFSFAAETVGEIGPDIASFMLGAGVGTVAGKTIAKKSLEKAVATQAAETAAKQGLTKEAAGELKDRLSARAVQGAVGQKATQIGANVGLQTGLWGTSLGTNIPDVFNSIYENIIHSG
jgi:hypothetical protein